LLKGTRKYWLIAVICGIMAAFLFFQYVQQLKASNQPGNLVQVVTASQNIKKDTVLTEEHLKIVKMPARYVVANSVRDKEKAVGKITLVDISAGEPILFPKLLSDRSSEKLSYSVPVSRRAVAIPVDSVSGVGGHVKAGDRVDIIGTLDIAPGGSDRPVSYSIYTLQNIPVLSVDSGDGKKSGNATNTMVLSVAPEEVQRLVLMSERGNLRLVLRSPVDPSTVTLPPLKMEDLLGY
jgi:pilus assembly protein CpaB